MILQLPAFAYGVVVLFWSLPLAVLFGYMPLCKFTGTRSDGYQWGKFLMMMFGVRAYRLGDGRLVTDRPCMYLCNHRSWADFFLDTYLTAGRGQLMSRMAVAIGFPFFMIAVALVKSGIIFKRVTLADKQKFNQWIDERLAASPVKGLLVYPEGHRSLRSESLPLKRGMLRYAYSRTMPVQMVITANKEHVMSEKKARARFGQKVVTSYSELVDPGQFESFDDFLIKVQAVWDAEWAKVYCPDTTTVLAPNVLSKSDYPYDSRTQLLVSGHTVMSLAAMVGFVYLLAGVFKLVGFLLGGTVAQVLLWSCTSILLVSIFIFSRPVPLNPKFALQKVQGTQNGSPVNMAHIPSSKEGLLNGSNGLTHRKQQNGSCEGGLVTDGDIAINGDSRLNGYGLKTANGLNGHTTHLGTNGVGVAAVQNGTLNGVHGESVQG